MKNKIFLYLLIAGIIILIIIGVYYLIYQKTSVNAVRIEGRIVCLPGKELGVSQFMDCSEYGLLANDGKYYEFAGTDSIEGGLGSFAPSQPVIISGKIINQKKYDTDGTIILTAISPKSTGNETDMVETETIEIEPERQERR